MCVVKTDDCVSDWRCQADGFFPIQPGIRTKFEMRKATPRQQVATEILLRFTLYGTLTTISTISVRFFAFLVFEQKVQKNEDVSSITICRHFGNCGDCHLGFISWVLRIISASKFANVTERPLKSCQRTDLNIPGQAAASSLCST